MGNRPKSDKDKLTSGNKFIYSCGAGIMGTDAWQPALDLCETENEVLVRLEVPGVSEDDLRIYFKEDALYIEGHKREPEFSRNDKVHFLCLERGYGSFQKIVRGKWIVNPREASASLKNGVLTVAMPKIDNDRGAVIPVPIYKQDDE
jgi:HSP20 family protein